MSRLTRVALTLLAAPLRRRARSGPTTSGRLSRRRRASGRHARDGWSGIARRPEVVRAVSRRPADALVSHGAEAELRGADRGRARAAGSCGIRDHASRSVSVRRRVSADVMRREHRRSGANQGIPAGADTSVSYTECGIQPRMGARRVGTAAAVERSGPCAISRDGGGPARCHHDARRGRERNVSGASRARSRAGDRHADARCRHQQPAAHRRAARRPAWRAGSTCARPSSCCSRRRDRSPSIEREIAQAENALSLLLGHVPGDVPRGRPLRGASGAAGRSGWPSIGAARAAARHPSGGAGADRRQRADWRGEGRVLPAHQPDGFPGRAESRADADLLTARRELATASLGATAPIFNAGPDARRTSSSRRRCSAKRS